MTDDAVPVILDTDIGDDIDDTWALAMMLRSSELDVRLVTGDAGKADYRAKLIAKMLTIANRTDIPVGLGIEDMPEGGAAQIPWIEDYNLNDYPGEVCTDGVDAMIRTIEASSQPVKLIVIGPMGNIAELVRRRPDLAAKTDFVGMHGSIALHHRDSPGAIAEYNVAKNIRAAQEVFAANWRSITITPLDTCGNVILDGDLYRRVLASDDPLIQATVENYRIWAGRQVSQGWDPSISTSILFDTVAVYLGYSHDFLRVQRMGIVVTDDGYTRVDETGAEINVAIEWTDKPAFLADLTRRLTSGA